MSKSTKALLTSVLSRGGNQSVNIPWDGSLGSLGEIPRQQAAVRAGGSNLAAEVGAGGGTGWDIISVVGTAACTSLLKFTPCAEQICTRWESQAPLLPLSQAEICRTHSWRLSEASALHSSPQDGSVSALYVFACPHPECLRGGAP